MSWYALSRIEPCHGLGGSTKLDSAERPRYWLNLRCETQYQPRSRGDAEGTQSVLCVSFAELSCGTVLFRHSFWRAARSLALERRGAAR